MKSPEELLEQVEKCKTSPDCHKAWNEIQACIAQYQQVYDICMIKYKDIRNTPVRESV